jgi:hypothetical protein
MHGHVLVVRLITKFLSLLTRLRLEHRFPCPQFEIMSTPACVSCQESLSCDDSPLSVTGNIIGILTFAGAIAISIQVYFNAMKNADRQIFEMMYTFRSRLEEVKLLRDKLEKKSMHTLNGAQGERLNSEMDRVAVLFAEADHRFSQLNDRRYNRTGRLLNRAKFVVKENLIKDGLEKIEKAMEVLKQVANDVLE